VLLALIWKTYFFETSNNPSHIAMTTRPASASEIRYAAMLASRFLQKTNVRHDRDWRDHFRREPYLHRRRPRAVVDFIHSAAGAFARAG
jgi:hypothetical protein